MLTLLMIDLFKLSVVTFLVISFYAILSGRVHEWLEYLGLLPEEEI